MAASTIGALTVHSGVVAGGGEMVDEGSLWIYIIEV